MLANFFNLTRGHGFTNGGPGFPNGQLTFLARLSFVLKILLERRAQIQCSELNTSTSSSGRELEINDMVLLIVMTLDLGFDDIDDRYVDFGFKPVTPSFEVKWRGRVVVWEEGGRTGGRPL